MPHFEIQCSDTVIDMYPAGEIIREVFSAATSTGLFNPKYVNVRLRSFRHHQAGPHDDDFIAVMASIMEGRTDEQKKNLSRTIVGKLIGLFPEVPLISMNIRDIDKISYVNREIFEE